MSGHKPVLRHAFNSFAAVLIVKIAFYFVVSLFFIWLLNWADIIAKFNWKYAVVMTIGLFLFSIIFVEAGYRRKKK